MKYISFAIPCYNSEEYMEKAIESILKGGEDVEIIVVNDGSKDNTAQIADEYARECADATGDGKVNVADAAKVYAYARGVGQL